MGKASQKVIRSGFTVTGGARRRDQLVKGTYNSTGETYYNRHTTYYSYNGNQAGNIYSVENDSNASFSHEYKNADNYGARIKFSDTPDLVVEPAAASEVISAELHLLFGSTWGDSSNLRGGVLSAELSGTAEERWSALNSAATSIILGGNSTAREYTGAINSPGNLMAYGFALKPTYYTPVTSETKTGSYMIAPASAEFITYVRNPAAKGEVSALSPGPYSNIVSSEDTTVSYRYDHNFGQYAQAYLSVIARNQDSGETVTICRKASVSVADGARGSFTIPADTLGIGRWTLSICAAPAASANYYSDTDAFWDGGQDFTYVVRENPSSSSVTCDGKPIPTVSWVSSAQAAYQVRFGDYDSGARVGSETSFTVPKIFRDGAYPVRVRTASSAGDWTDWTETEYVAIENVEPSGEFDVTAAQEGTVPVLSWGGGVRLEWEQGAISSGSGANSEGASGTPSATRIRTPEDKMIPVASDALTVTIPSGMQWYVMRYSSPSVGDFISAAGWKTTSGATGAQAGEYVRFVLAYNPAAAIGPSDGSKLQAAGSVVAAAHYAIFRNGEMIAVTDQNATQYVDRLGAGGEYEVLAVTADRYYKSSGPIPFRLRLAADLISADGGYTWIPCRLTPDRKTQPEDIREDMTFVYYAGAQKPAAFRTNQLQRTKQFSYIFFRRDAARALRDLVGHEIIVRTTRGERIRGAVAEMSWADAKQPVVSFSVREVRGEEDGVEYPA